MELVSPEFEFRTERLLLRPLTPADENDLYKYQSLPDVVRYIPWPARTMQQVHDALINALANNRLSDEGDYALLGVVLPSTGHVIGQLSLMYRSKEDQRAEIGYVIHPDFTGQGFATEACSALVTLLFNTGKFHRIVAKIDARNSPSEAVAKKLGFRKEAHMIHEEYFKGEWTDTLIYAILIDEWQSIH